VASLDLEWRRRGAYRNGEACGMDLNLAPGKETEGAREERVTTTLPLPVVEQRFLSFGCNSTVDIDALTLDHIY
jgi:hypothetical protein